MPRETLRYGEFVQLVRKHRRRDVLAACGHLTAQLYSEPPTPETQPAFLPFAVAGIARAALCFGNNFRHGAPPDLARMRYLCSAFVNVHDPFIDDGEFQALMVRMAHEQFIFQNIVFNDATRTQALLIDAAANAASPLITPSFWRDLLGCSTQEFFGVAMLLFATASQHNGRFNPRELGSQFYAPAFTELPRELIEAMYRRHFSRDATTHKEIAERHPVPPARERFALNPLRLFPFVTGEGDKNTPGEELAVAPVVPFIMQRVGPGSLYYTAVERHGKLFTDELGRIFEHYVGQHLLQLTDTVHPEIRFDGPNGEMKSVDFLAVMPNLVLLVEVKATPMRAAGRRGEESLKEDIDRTPGKALSQIERSSQLIQEQHPSFRHIPADRPRIGLIVTLEPYFMLLVESKKLPTWLASSSDLEQLVTMTAEDLQTLLTEHITEDHISPVHPFLSKANLGKNAIMDAAWEKLPFHSLPDADTA